MPEEEKKKTVLIVEDEASYRDILAEALGNEGIGVVTAENGKDALNLLEEFDEGPDLIILDLLMPEMTGWNFMYKLKDIKKNNIPILILTNLSETSYPSQVPVQIDFVVKANVSFNEVVDKVKKILGL